MGNMRKYPLVAFSILVCSLLLALYWHFTRVHAEEEAFESIRWKERHTAAQLNDPGCVRGGMAVSLVQSKTLVGKTKPELLALLGDHDKADKNKLLFNLGQCHWDWKHNALVIRMDPRGYVREATIEVSP